MKKVFSLFIVMAFVFSAFAQDANTDKPKKVKEPEITFEKLTHDYGNITQGDNGTCEFVFKNTGKADLFCQEVNTHNRTRFNAKIRTNIPPKNKPALNIQSGCFPDKISSIKT